MQINDVVKKVFLVIVMFTILGLISMIPMGECQKAYMKKRQQYQASPQIHVDATERYVEAIMAGEEDVSKGIKARAPRKYYLPFFKNDNIEKKHANKIKVRIYDKPLYVRDKDNPKVLKPYNKFRFK